jgi:hypothetical protein
MHILALAGTTDNLEYSKEETIQKKKIKIPKLNEPLIKSAKFTSFVTMSLTIEVAGSLKLLLALKTMAMADNPSSMGCMRHGSSVMATNL